MIKLTPGRRFEVTLFDHGQGRAVTEQLLVARVDRGGFLGYAGAGYRRYVALTDVVAATQVGRS